MSDEGMETDCNCGSGEGCSVHTRAMTNPNPAAPLGEMIVPEGATPKAIAKCARAMHYLLEIGWPKTSLPELERLWWTVHDEEGKVKP